jgi:two-component system cell cycle response regulator
MHDDGSKPAANGMGPQAKSTPSLDSSGLAEIDARRELLYDAGMIEPACSVPRMRIQDRRQQRHVMAARSQELVSNPKHPPFRAMSLRTRFVLGVSAMLLPLLLLGAIALFSLQHMAALFEEALDDPVREMHAIMNLQTQVGLAAMPPNDYLIHGEAAEREKFSRLRMRVDRAFDEAMALESLWPTQRELLHSARAEWQQARHIANALLALPAPVGNPAAAQAMKRMDAHIDRAISILGESHTITQHEMNEAMVRARTIQNTSLQLIVGAAGVLGLLIAAGSGLLLARFVLRPLHELEIGAKRLGAGNYGHRVRVNTGDELEDMADTFNAMAARLEKDRLKLKELATRDGLTGLYNHKTFYAFLDDEVDRSRRHLRPFTLLIIDIDHFKRVNDTHGHQAGDMILRGLSERLVELVRTIDRVCRYGGEEITVILPDTETAFDMADRLRAAIESAPFDIGSGKTVGITVSIGLAVCPHDADSSPALVAAADAALYAAKEGGRNRVCRYENPGQARPAAQYTTE